MVTSTFMILFIYEDGNLSRMGVIGRKFLLVARQILGLSSYKKYCCILTIHGISQRKKKETSRPTEYEESDDSL
jgi:hypothetical protein